MFTVSLMLPAPATVKPVAPPVAVAVQLSLWMAAGRASLTVAPMTSLGPLLLTTIVYVVVVPGTTVTTPSVLVIARSACAASVSLSVALAGVALAGSVTVTVLANGLAARLDAKATGAVNVSELPAPAAIDAPVA